MADKIRVLYVDDEEALIEVGKMFLEWTGSFSVTTAMSAREAIQVLKNERFDAIVSDYQMPKMNGIELLKQLKAGGDITPFVILTGKGREEVVIEALNAGADGYLQKGGEPNAQFAELSHMIKKAVGSRQAEVTIRNHERREAEIINFLPDATFAIDTHGIVIAWNRAMEEMTGVLAADMLGKGNYEYALPFYHERRPIAVDLVLHDDPTVAATYPFMTRERHTLVSEIYLPHLNNGNGAYLWFTASPVYDAAGNRAGAIESIRDITAKKRAEQGLRIARDEYASLLERMTDVYYRTDNKGNLIRASSYLVKSLGYDDLSECLGKNIAETFYADPDERRKLLEAIYHDREVTDYEITLKKKDGTLLPVATSSYLYYDDAGNVLGIEGTCRDITDRKNAEIALQEREAYYRTIFENTGTASVIIEEDTTISLANAEYVRLSGYSREEIEGKRRWTEFVVPEDLDRMLSEHHKRRSAPQTSQPHYEFRFITKSGEIRTIYLSIDVFPGTKKSIASLLDITDRKQAEDAIRESEERLDLALRSAEMGVWHWDILQNKRTFDLQTCRLFGIDPGTFLGSAEEFYAVVHPDDRERLKDAIARTVDQDLLYEPSYRVILADGSVRFVTARGRLVRDAQGRPTRINGIVWDITGWKKSEQALRESEERFRRLAENAPGVLYRISLMNGKFEYVSPAVTEISGYTPREYYDNPHILRQVIHPDWITDFDREWQSVLRGQVSSTYECQIIDKTGTVHWINQHTMLIQDTDGHPVALEGIITDITRRKQMEASLRESEERYSSIFNNSDFVSLLIDPDTAQIVDANAAAARYYGYSTDQLRMMGVYDLNRLPKETVIGSFQAAKTEKSRHLFSTHYRASGEPRDVDIYSGLITLHQKPHFYSILHDITERRRVEESVKTLRQFQESVIKNAHIWITVLDKHGVVSVWNRAAEEISGYGADEVIGTSTIWSRMYPDKEYRRTVTEKINQVLGIDTFLENFETTIRTKAGEERIIWWNTRTLQDVVGIEETFIAIGRDVTRQMALTRAVQEANRKLNLLASITRHDIINQVHALKGYLALSQHLLGNPGKLAEFIAKEQRIADTIEDQIQFTKDYECIGIKSPEWQEVNTCISRAKESLSLEGITVTIDLLPLEVYADPLLSRVFYNLIDNAIRYGGAQMTTIRFSSEEAGRRCVITCADDGEGIPADKKEAIFTQDYFKHTGLGLFLSREILAITGITIAETGVPGEGARFEITVPDGMWRKKGRE